MSVELRFLGQPRFARDGQPAEITSAKAVALLAYLAAGSRPQPRERLLALLWAESAAEAARKNLRNTLWVIRRSLGDKVIVAGEDRLTLAESVWTDLAAFAAATEAAGDTTSDAAGKLQLAADLYSGPFLEGLNVSEAPDFELWLTAERERLAQSYLHILSVLAGRHRAAGRWRDVITVGQAALREDNLQEPMYRALMEAYARLGDRAAALRQYDTAAAVLDRELGVEPLPETQALAAAIRDQASAGAAPRPGAAFGGAFAGAPAVNRGDPAAAPLAGALASARPASDPVRPRLPAPPPFVGRQAERAVLDEEKEAIAAGARVVLLTGPVGIGKSRLWQEWSGPLRSGSDWALFETRCLEATQTLPFAPLVSLLRDPRCLHGALGPGTSLPRVWLAELGRLLPEIRIAHPDLPVPSPLPADEERRRLFEAIVQALLAAGRASLIFFLDDAHWADQATLDWLAYLADRLHDRRLLLVVAYRPDNATPGLTRLATGWLRQGTALRLPLSRLSQEEAAALIVSLGVAPLATHTVQAQAAGNPYFVIELAAAQRDQAGGQALDEAPRMPPVLAELLAARLDRLSHAARQVLQAGAILEPDFDFGTLRRASGRDEEETLDALDELLSAGLLVERAAASSPLTGTEDLPAGGAAQHSAFNFSHPLVPALVRAGLSGARRVYLYRRAAEALEATHSGRLPEVAGRLAAAYAYAGEPGRAATYADMAAARAMNLDAAAEAAGFYRQALALEPTPERRLGLARALIDQAPPSETRAIFQEALDGFVAGGDRLGAARASLELATTYLGTGRGDEVLKWAEQSLAYLDTHAHPDADPEAHARAHFLLGAGRVHMGGGLDEAEAQLAEAARLADEKGLPGIAAHSTFELGNLLAQRGDLAGAVKAYHSSIGQARAANAPLQQVLGYNNAAYHETLAGDLAAAHADIDAGLALNDELELVTPREWLYSTRGELALAEGRWDEADAWLGRALAEAERMGNQEHIAGCRANLARAAAGRGDLDRGLNLLHLAADTAADLPGAYLKIQIDLWLVELLRQRGDRAEADAALARARSRLAGTRYDRLAAWAQSLAAES